MGEGTSGCGRTGTAHVVGEVGRDAPRSQRLGYPSNDPRPLVLGDSCSRLSPLAGGASVSGGYLVASRPDARRRSVHDRDRCRAPIQSPESATEAYADKIFTALLGTMETFSLYLGERLGWLAALAAGPLTPAELAARTGDRASATPSNGWRCRRSTATSW